GADDLGRQLGTIRDVVTQDLEYLASNKCRADAEFWADRLAECDTAPSDHEAAPAHPARAATPSLAPAGHHSVHYAHLSPDYLATYYGRDNDEIWADRLAEGDTATSGSEAAQARTVRTARTTIAPLGLSTELKTGLSTELKTGLSKELTTRSWPAAVTAAVA